MLRRSARLLNAAQSAKSNANNFHVSVKLDKLVFDRKAKQFYILVDAAKAFVEYKRVDSRTLDLTLTKVPESLRGKGIGQILAKEVFEFCLAHEIKVKLSCDFLQHYYDKHRNIYEDIYYKNSQSL